MSLTRVSGKVLNTSVATIGDLPTTGYEGQAIIVNHFYSDAEGGGGPFIWSNEAKSTHNGVTIVDPATTVTPGATGWWTTTSVSGNGVWKRQYDGAVNVKWSGAKGDNSTNDSEAFNKTLTLGNDVNVPKGIYLINSSYSVFVNIIGEGSKQSILKPVDTSTPILTFSGVNTLWDYPAKVQGIGFYSSGKLGIGYSFGIADHADTTVNGQYTRHISFYNVYFNGFDKGVFFPRGAIGTSFYDCGFAANRYGAYLLDNKAGGDVMHAGNKYFYSGEFSVNDVGVYIHNVTDGFGSVHFKDTIFEYNKISLYYYTNTSTPYTPVSLYGCWQEGNGSLQGGTVTVDTYIGTTKGSQVEDAKTFILDGANAILDIKNSFACDINVKGLTSKVFISNSRVEEASGYTGGSITTSTTSSVHLVDCYGDSFVGTTNVIIDSYRKLISDALDLVSASGRCAISSSQFEPIFNTNTSSLVNSVAGTVASAISGTSGGSFSLVSSENSSIPKLNKAVLTLTGSNAYRADSTLTTFDTAGWYLVSVNVYQYDNPISVSFWDLGSNQFWTYANTTHVGNTTFYGIRYLDNTSRTMGIWFSGSGGTTNVGWNGFQVHRFDTYNEAHDFANKKLFTAHYNVITTNYTFTEATSTSGVPVTVIDFSGRPFGIYTYSANLPIFPLAGFEDNGFIYYLDSGLVVASNITPTPRVNVAGTTITYTQSTGGNQTVQFDLFNYITNQEIVFVD